MTGCKLVQLLYPVHYCSVGDVDDDESDDDDDVNDDQR